MTEYTSAARRQLEELRAVIDLHAIEAASGRCVECRVPGPCLPRKDALYVLDVRYQLPHRLPGATRPEAIGARRVRV